MIKTFPAVFTKCKNNSNLINLYIYTTGTDVITIHINIKISKLKICLLQYVLILDLQICCKIQKNYLESKCITYTIHFNNIYISNIR